MKDVTSKPTHNYVAITAIMAAGLVLRLAVLVIGMDKGLYFPDEAEYVELADNLAEGNGFSYKGNATSFRPPGFPFLLSLVFRLSGDTSPAPARAMQVLLSMVTIWVIYRFGRDGWGENTGRVAAAIFAFYPSLIGYNNILLTETSFILCISVACWALVRYFNRTSEGWASIAGISLGLGALIRDTLVYSGPLTTLFLLGHAWRTRQTRVWHVAAFAGSFLITILPWIIRNSLLHGQFAMISTVGGITFYLCNNEEAPLIRTPPIFFERPIEQNQGYYYETLLPELNGLSEPDKQNAAMRKGFEEILANPRTSALRMLGRLVDFWGQERLIINQVLSDYYGYVPLWIFAFLIVVTFGIYSSAIMAACFGYFFARWRAFEILSLLVIAYYTAMHMAVFAHPRYHLPLLPFIAVLAARAFLLRAEIFANWRSWRFAAAASLATVFVVIWGIGIFCFDAEQVTALIQRLG